MPMADRRVPSLVQRDRHLPRTPICSARASAGMAPRRRMRHRPRRPDDHLRVSTHTADFSAKRMSVQLSRSLLVSRSFWDAHSSILGLILCLGLIVTFTDIVKITVGRPRPDLFSRCQLPADLTADPTHGLTSWTACTQTDKLKDGFRSFPSGHSSFAWGGMWYFTLWAGGSGSFPLAYLSLCWRADGRTARLQQPRVHV